jgi:hypothetical protein
MIYSLFPENPIALPVFGFFFSLPCFWYIVTQPALAASGRFGSSFIFSNSSRLPLALVRDGSAPDCCLL